MISHPILQISPEKEVVSYRLQATMLAAPVVYKNPLHSIRSKLHL